MKKYLLILSALLATSAYGKSPDELLNGLKPDLKSWVEKSCSKNLGPSLWSSCVTREVNALNGHFPDLSILSKDQKTWLMNSCPSSLGPSLTISCYNREYEALGRIPSFSGLSEQQTNWVKQSCSTSLGPSLYASCLNREISAVKNAGSPQPQVVSKPNLRAQTRPVGSNSRNSYAIEVSHNDELFIINGEKFEAKTYCLGWYEGDEVIFVDGSPYGACSSAKLLNLSNKELCEVWCE